MPPIKISCVFDEIKAGPSIEHSPLCVEIVFDYVPTPSGDSLPYHSFVLCFYENKFTIFFVFIK